MGARLRELASLVRSKNAGPFWLTFDVMFADASAYTRARDGGALSPAKIARLFGQREEDVRVFAVDAALALKISFPRPYSSGSALDGDVYAGQQYAPLLDIEI